jgi:hypothetical protein
MKRLGLMTLTVPMMSILLLSTACHKIGPLGKGQFIVYVNEKDNSQILGFEASPQPLRQWWHGEPKDPSPQGEYFRNDGKLTSGSYWMDGNVFVVNNARFSIQPNLSIRDENGVTWIRTDVNGPAIKHAELHEIRK